MKKYQNKEIIDPKTFEDKADINQTHLSWSEPRHFMKYKLAREKNGNRE